MGTLSSTDKAMGALALTVRAALAPSHWRPLLAEFDAAFCPEELEVPIRDARLQLISERKAHRAEGQESRDKIEENIRSRKEIGENDEKIEELARIISDENS